MSNNHGRINHIKLLAVGKYSMVISHDAWAMFGFEKPGGWNPGEGRRSSEALVRNT